MKQRNTGERRTGGQRTGGSATGKPGPDRKPPRAVQADAPKPARAGRTRRADTGAGDNHDRPRLPEAAPGSSSREVRLYGINACRAFVARRREQVIRAYFTEAVGRRHFAALMKWLAQQRLAYHLVTEGELEKITGSAHHEGVCLLVRSEPPSAALDWPHAHRRLRRSCVLALENVGNPHNLGAILRTAAHFGVEAVMVPDAGALAGGAAVRTAEGGAEHVAVLDAPGFMATVQAFRAAGWRVVTTSSHQGKNLYEATLPEKCLLLFGEESAGLSAAMLDTGDLCVCIPGTGHVESLNVSVAAGVLVSEWWRQHPPAR